MKNYSVILYSAWHNPEEYFFDIEEEAEFFAKEAREQQYKTTIVDNSATIKD
jgi:hypothetical protein